ncbi:MAG: hypothetical protein U0930_08040 [Pirellulales bacterium]
MNPLPIICPPTSLKSQFCQVSQVSEELKGRFQQSIIDLESLYAMLSQQAFNGRLDLSRVIAPETETNGRGTGDRDDRKRKSKVESPFWFGLPGDIPIVGDFEQDGLNDGGVYRRGGLYLGSREKALEADSIFELPTPKELGIPPGKEFLKAVLKRWLDDYLDSIGKSSPFVLDAFIELAELKVSGHLYANEDNGSDNMLLNCFYDAVKEFVFESIENKKLLQDYDGLNNRVRISINEE